MPAPIGPGILAEGSLVLTKWRACPEAAPYDGPGEQDRDIGDSRAGDDQRRHQERMML